MTRNQETIALVPGQYRELTAGPADVISFQVRNGQAELRATAGSTAPDASAKGWIVDAGDFALARPMSELFSAPGMTRIWGRATKDELVEVQVDHASV